MKRSVKLMLGVTLLEIMLVLAIAAMIIVMSIRYYQNASNAQNTNLILEEIQNLTAAADSLSQGTGSYSAVTTSAVTTVAGSANMKTPYNQSITLSDQGKTVYTVTVGAMPAAVCASLAAKLKANAKYTSPSCSTSGVLTYTYDVTK